MTREEIIEAYESAVFRSGLSAAAGNEEAARDYELLKAGLSALLGPTREQVERMRGMILSDVSDWDGSWNAKCSRCGATIGLGSEGEYDITHKYRFCPMCMSPFTDEAVDMMLERWKEALDENT